MIFTQEQFEKILDGDKGVYMDDLPFETQGLEFFNSLPEHLQGEALQWGFGDTVVRENIFVFLIENQFGMTPKEYYSSGILDKYFETKVPTPINFKRFKMTRKELLKEKLESKHTVVSFENKDKRTSFDETFEQNKMKIAAKTMGLDLVKVKPSTSNIIECVSPVFKYETSNEAVILFEKDYHGFEDMFDLDRDMSEILSFGNENKIPSEFTGIVRVLVEYFPSDEDIKNIK